MNDSVAVDILDSHSDGIDCLLSLSKDKFEELDRDYLRNDPEKWSVTSRNSLTRTTWRSNSAENVRGHI